MSTYRTMKPRPPGSIYEAITSAIGQIPGGLTSAAEAIDRPRTSLHAAGDPDTPARKKVKLSMQEAAILAGLGGTAIADFFAERAGGVFVPLDDMSCASAIQDAIAAASRETGEAISAAIIAVATAGLCGTDRAIAAREIRDAIKALSVVLAGIEADTNVEPLRRAS